MAAPNTVEVRQPKVSVEGEATDTLTMSWTVPVSSGINGSPCAKYSTHAAGGKEVDTPTAAKLITKIATAQKSMFESLETKDITVFDGDSNMLFSGYDVGPHHEVLFGSVANGRTVVHRCSRLGYLDTSIYVAPVGGGLKDVKEPSAGDSPTKYMKLVLDEMIKNFEEVTDATMPKVALEIRKRTHKNNKAIIAEEWNSVLSSSSTVNLDGFSDFVKTAGNTYALVEAIAAVYVNGAADFFQRISQFEMMFQIQFIPSSDSTTAGKFISVKDLTSNPKSKAVNVRGMSITGGPRTFLPITSVVMLGLPAGGVKDMAVSAGSAVSCWPEPVSPYGTILSITSPSWIPSSILVEKDISTSSAVSTNPDLDAYENMLNVGVGEIEKIDKAIYKVAQDFCRCYYNNAALGSSRASVTTLLDITWEIGTRYKVTQEGGSVLFEGFLQNIEHRVSSVPGRADATTQLTFSHVEANGFTLPNK